LRKLCKDRNLHNAHIKTKDGLISLLERNPLDSVYDDNKVNYNKMNMKELKKLAKDRGFTSYNNLKKDELIKNHVDFDELENEKVCDESKVDECEESKDSYENILETKVKIIEIFKFNDKVIRTIGTYDEPWFVAKDICDILNISNNRDAIAKIPEKWKKDDVGFSDTLNRTQKMTIINEPAVYKIIMRSNKPVAEKFQEFVCEDILPSIRKKGEYKIEDRNKMILQRPVRKLLDLSEIDIEAEELEIKYDWSLYTNKCVLYIAYIGKSLVKLGYSDCKIHQREKKHTSCESQYEQFRMIKAFEISGEPIEKKIKELLSVYNVKFHNQSEIFKPPSTLNNFIETIETLLRDNDLKITLELVQKENTKLKLRISELEKENLELRLK
jgi:prophage antirepressor-like protein